MLLFEHSSLLSPLSCNLPRKIQNHRRHQLDPHHELCLRPKPMLDARHSPLQTTSEDSHTDARQRHASVQNVVAGPPDDSAGAGQYAFEIADLTISECAAWASRGEDSGVGEHVLAGGVRFMDNKREEMARSCREGPHLYAMSTR